MSVYCHGFTQPSATGKATMQVDEATVRHIARLARITVSKKEAARLKDELSAILDWVEQLDEVDTEKVAPMARVGDIRLHPRADEITDGERVGDILANAPMAEDNFFVVPKVVE
jgi:aspartyl-tRNA(Asn)/glutamyl-tRNA(Gln) amidotransferase subunit C